MSNNGLPIDFFSFNKYHHLTPLPLIYIYSTYINIYDLPQHVSGGRS